MVKKEENKTVVVTVSSSSHEKWWLTAAAYDRHDTETRNTGIQDEKGDDQRERKQHEQRTKKDFVFLILSFFLFKKQKQNKHEK